MLEILAEMPGISLALVVGNRSSAVAKCIPAMDAIYPRLSY